MGLTEGHWFEDEEPELTEKQLEDRLWENNKIFERGYQKGFSDGKAATQESVAPLHKCSGCLESYTLVTNKYFLFCPYCGRKVNWND